MPHVVDKPGVLRGTALAVFLAVVHFANDATSAILGALLPTLQERFDAGPTLLASLVSVFWVASSLTQPLFGSLAEDVGMRAIAALGVAFAAAFLSLIGVASELWLVFALVVVGGLGSAAIHPVATAIAGGPSVRNRTLGVGFFTAGGMIGFAVGPVAILYLIAHFGTDATVWLVAPGLALGAAVALLLPQWQPHGRRPLHAMFDWSLLRGPIGLLALAGSLTSVAFVTFTSTIPIWLVREHGYATDAALIGWTLSAFALAAGGGSLLGGYLAPRIGRRNTIVGSLLAAAPPLGAVVLLEPGTVPFFGAAAAAGVLIYTASPVKVIVAQDLAPHAPAAASGMILGVAAAIAGALYIALGRVQETIGLEAGMLIGFAMVVPAAGISLAALARRPHVAR
jgi:FSR family fosmidomycin resistance protein-like MFS transporter